MVTGESDVVGWLDFSRVHFWCAPTGTVMEAGTVTFEVSELAKFTVSPPSGTGSEKYKIGRASCRERAKMSELGLRVSEKWDTVTRTEIKLSNQSGDAVIR